MNTEIRRRQTQTQTVSPPWQHHQHRQRQPMAPPATPWKALSHGLGRCHQTPRSLFLPPAALISCSSTAACPTSLGCGPSSFMLRFRQQLAGGPGVPAARSQIPAPRRPASPQVPRVPSGPTPALWGSTEPRRAHRPERSTCGAEGHSRAGRTRRNNACCTPATIECTLCSCVVNIPAPKTAPLSSCTLCLVRGCLLAS